MTRRRTATEFYTAAEAAALLDVDRRTVYRLIKEGKLPGTLRVGRQFRIPRRALEALIVKEA
jgi:excisionase family DNA binding protein